MLLLEIPLWLNYPGLELWKFINLAVFITVGIFILRKPLQTALSARRETIKSQIERAQKERDEAAASLAEAQSLLAATDADVQNIRAETRKEVE